MTLNSPLLMLTHHNATMKLFPPHCQSLWSTEHQKHACAPTPQTHGFSNVGSQWSNKLKVAFSFNRKDTRAISINSCFQLTTPCSTIQWGYLCLWCNQKFSTMLVAFDHHYCCALCPFGSTCQQMPRSDMMMGLGGIRMYNVSCTLYTLRGQSCNSIFGNYVSSLWSFLGCGVPYRGGGGGGAQPLLRRWTRQHLGPVAIEEEVSGINTTEK